jgi:hypothetical protein
MTITISCKKITIVLYEEKYNTQLAIREENELWLDIVELLKWLFDNLLISDNNKEIVAVPEIPKIALVIIITENLFLIA